MKIGIFTDSHYSSAELSCSVRENSKALARIEKAMEHFKAWGCDLVVCLGDVTDYEDTHEKEVANLASVAKVLKSSGLPVTVVMGNHDGFAFTPEEFYSVIGMKCIPETTDADGKTLVFLDACYYADGEKYRPGKEDWTDTFLPRSELEKLQKAVEGATSDVLVFLHQNLDRDVWADHRVKNADEICDYLEKSKKVKYVFQGHCHPGKESVHGGVIYKTFPALCEKEDAYFVVEI